MKNVFKSSSLFGFDLDIKAKYQLNSFFSRESDQIVINFRFIFITFTLGTNLNDL